MAEYTVNVANKGAQASTFSIIVGGIYGSPLFYLYLALKVLILGTAWLLFAVWDLITTIFAAFWSIITNYRFLLAFAIVFVALIFIHLYWSGFVHIIRHFIMPVLDVLYNDILRFLWNTLLLVVLNLLIYVWDSLVQLIGFFIYFALNVIITIAYLVVQILGVIHLGDFIEAFMKILTPIVQIVVAVLQVLIKAGVAILKVALPIIIALLKIYIQYIKIIFKIVSWLLITLFKALFPILKAIVAVVKFVTKVFFHKALGITARALLSVRDAVKNSGKSAAEQDRIYDDANRLNVFEAYTTSLRYYAVHQYEEFLEQMQIVHDGIRSQDAFHGTDGYFLDPGLGVPDYNKHLYDDAELAEHEKAPVSKKRKSPSSTKPPQSANKKAKPSTNRKLSGLLDEADLARKNLLDALGQSFAEEDSSDDVEEKYFVDVNYIHPPPGGHNEDEDDSVDEDIPIGNEWKSNSTLIERHNEWLKDPELWWRIDLSHNMTSEEVFPHLKGRKLRRAQLHKLVEPDTPEKQHHVRKLATAYRHAVEHAYYRAYKRHISSGHFHKAVKDGWKHLTGHDDLDSWVNAKFGKQRYASAGHFLHSVIPDFTNMGFFKLWKDADPSSKERLYHHDYVRKVCPECTDGVLPREVYEHLENQERWNEEQDYLNSGNGQPSSPLPGCEGPQAAQDKYCLYGGRSRDLRGQTGRKLHITAKFEPFGLNLEFLYNNDCFTTKVRNILCIPSIPNTWILPHLDFKGVFFTDDLNNNTACEPTWKSTSCIVCWDGVYNMFVELRFLIYWFDLVWKILIFGIFFPAPSEWLGYLGKVFPPFRPLVNWFLLYPPGVFPNGQAFACFFINLIYLFELILLLLIAYYIVNPLFQFLRRQYWALWQLVVGINFGIARRREYMMFFNESLLARQKAEFTQIYKQKLADKSRAMHIGDELGGGGAAKDTESADRLSELHANTSIGTGIDSAVLRDLIYKDPGMANKVIGLTNSIEEKTTLIRSRIDEMATRLGITDQEVARNFSPQKKRPVWISRMHRSWQRVTSLMHIPPELTPSFAEGMIQMHDRKQKAKHNISKNAIVTEQGD
jgi:hypothetical protein